MGLLKSVVLGLGFLFSLSSFAGETVVRCVTSSPTTSYFIVEEPDRFDLIVYHHNGVNFMPIHSGTVAPHDLPMLFRRAEQLKKMGDRAVVSFSKNECKNDGILWRCFSKEPAQVGGLKVENVGFAMGHLESSYEGAKWSSTETYLHLKINKELVTIPLSFPEGSCRGKQ